jgi:hypothetical protein
MTAPANSGSLAMFTAIVVNERPLALSLVGGGLPGAALDLGSDKPSG